MILRTLPHRLDDTTIPGVLSAIGLPMPAGAELKAASGKPLSSTGYRRTVTHVDAALDTTSLSVADRLALKIAMLQRGLLGS